MTVPGDYHITRAPEWTSTRGAEISDREWQYYARQDAELSPDLSNGPNAFVWQAHPDANHSAWLDWSRGNIYSSDPDQPLIAKMQELARVLRARLVTDDNLPVTSGSGN